MTDTPTFDEDRPPPCLIDNAEIVAASREAEDTSLDFDVDDDEQSNVWSFAVKQSARAVIDPNSFLHTKARRQGYTGFFELFAVRKDDGLPYAVWTVFSGPGNMLKTDVVEVDHRFQGRGIGTAFRKEVKSFFNIAPSDTLTRAGAALRSKDETGS